MEQAKNEFVRLDNDAISDRVIGIMEEFREQMQGGLV